MTVFGDIKLRFKIKFKTDESLRGKCLDFSQVTQTLHWFEEQILELKRLGYHYSENVEPKCPNLSFEDKVEIDDIICAIGRGMKSFERGLYQIWTYFDLLIDKITRPEGTENNAYC
jgi:hypothetical protein